MFGDLERRSESAIHVPIIAGIGTSRECLFGVLSAQAYHRNVYQPEHVRALQMLADLAGAWLQHTQNDAAQHHHTSSALPQKAENTRPAVAITDEVIGMMRNIRERAENLRDKIPPEDADARLLAEQLCDDCRRIQSEALQLPLRPDFLQKPLLDRIATDSNQAAKLNSLTRTERIVLGQLAQTGDEDGEIAARLTISTAAVKFHMRNILSKLEVPNRTQAVLFVLSPAFSRERHAE